MMTEKISTGVAMMIVGGIVTVLFAYSFLTQTPVFTTEQLSPYISLIAILLGGFGFVLFINGFRRFLDGLTGQD